MAVCYNARQDNAIQYNTIQYNAIQYNAIQDNTIQYNKYNTIQCNKYNAIQYNAIQYNTINTIQCNTIQYNTITPITQNNTQPSRQPSICTITKKNHEHILYTIKTQKRVEPKVDESVLQTTRYIKQSVNHTIQYSVTHILPRPIPHSTSLLFISHPALNPFPSLNLADLNLTSNSLHFTSLHLTLP